MTNNSSYLLNTTNLNLTQIVELKSFKEYLQQYRDVVISYERLLNQLYDHMQEVYSPQRLRLVLVIKLKLKS